MIADSYIERVENLILNGGRRILGIAGAPGSGKSTLAQALVEALPGRAVVVPMDGFHLANVELARLGRASRKGAEDTFDSAGFVALLRRLREQRPDETVYAPAFRREIEEPIAGAIPVFPDIPLVITEGNYLLLDRGHWAKVRGLLDEAWYVDIDPALRYDRLVARHIAFGRDERAAREWVANTDEPNALLIDSTRPRANVLFEWA
ncbi:nucleoside/nucleotide kinase family protein [Pararobbsia silviterrae]|uniref:Nucleoside/nucleotide kinase family protein n=1 Tax=Pararobbsia silviterrae TaxID=1792498 RepID=A0A494XDJ5_9BURK|nr:nucleoside/nucleotide kinase family protein [Pararobbsia silviterrae]RKP46229.1 nucleoside/nucleotide kinase family protein [Pararobbsia silviterrae]